MNIGETIKRLRQEKGLSQEQLAEHFHVTRQSISNWENNRNYPDLDTLVQISKYFQVSLDALLGDDQRYVQQNTAATRNSRRNKRIILALTAVLLIMLVVIIVLVRTKGKEKEAAPLDFGPISNMSVAVGDLHNYSNDKDVITKIAETLRGNYEAIEPVIIDPEDGAFLVQLWDDPDGIWYEIIVIDERTIVYNGWKCTKIDLPIDLQLLEEAFEA